MAANTVLPSQMVMGITQAEDYPSLTYRVDLHEGRVLGMIDGVEAVRQAAMLALLTPRFKCRIFDNQYGSEFYRLIADPDATQELVEAEIDRMVRDALRHEHRIVEITSIDSEFYGAYVHITIGMTTVYGDTNLEVYI